VNIDVVAEQIADSVLKEILKSPWREHIRKTAKYEKDMHAMMYRLFEQQKAEVRANVRKTSKALYNPEIISSWMFGTETWVGKFQEGGEPIILEAGSDFGKAQLSILAEGVDWNPEAVEEYSKARALNYSKEIMNTTYIQLHQEFMSAIGKGETVQEIYERIDKVYNFAEKYRTVRIARTEVTGASNHGALQGYLQSGRVRAKMWVTAEDERVRDEHMAMDGETRDPDELFSNGTMFPGDPNADISTTINCRCTMVPVRRGE